MQVATPSTGTSQPTSNSYTTSSGSGSSSISKFSVSSGDEPYPNGQILPAANLRIFTFAELKAATKNFRPDTVLGEGGFGKVFKGWIEEKPPSKNGSGTVIAVKKLNSESLQGIEEWKVILLGLTSLSLYPNLAVNSSNSRLYSGFLNAE